MCLFDLRTRELTGRYVDLGGDAVTSVCFSPGACPFPAPDVPSKKQHPDGGCWLLAADPHTMYTASEGTICCIDLKKVGRAHPHALIYPGIHIPLHATHLPERPPSA